MTVLVVGSVALDSVETPFGKADNVLGGSGTFLLGVGQPPGAGAARRGRRDRLSDGCARTSLRRSRRSTSRGSSRRRARRSVGAADTATISTSRRRSRRTSACSRISGRRFPRSSATRHSSFSATSIPRLQLDVLTQVAKPKLVACDTMNFWIESRRPDLMKLLEHVDLITLNDAEARQLTERVRTS